MVGGYPTNVGDSDKIRKLDLDFTSKSSPYYIIILTCNI